MDKDDEALKRAYAALDAAVRATGSERHVLLEEALKLWRLARCAGDGDSPSDGPSGDETAT